MFGSKKSMKQVIRENKRMVNRSIREIDRKLNQQKREQKKMQNEIKRLTKQGQMEAVKHLCKDMVRIKQTQPKLIRFKATLRQLSQQFDNTSSINDNSIQQTLKELNKCYQSVSHVIKLPELQLMLQKYMVETHHMEMRSEYIDDAMDDALDADSDEADELYARVLDEVGLDLGDHAFESSAKMCCSMDLADAEVGLQTRLSRINNIANEINSATIGLSVGGAKDVNNFRECIESNRMPSNNSITYNGLLYEYYFDTKKRKHELCRNNDDEKHPLHEKDDGSQLFYPSYCYAKTKRVDFLAVSDEMKDRNDEYEYYMTVGLNSNIKMNEFKRKHLNLVIVLDKSGSMSTRWDNKTKMQVANESVVALLSHLTPKDRIGIITFNTAADTIHAMQFVNDVDLNDLKKSILSIRQAGGTDFECGYRAAAQLYQQLFNDNEYKLNSVNHDYDNRVIFLTDARPNSGRTDANSLLGMVQTYAENQASDEVKLHTEYNADEYIRNRIYTTFIGIGVDFNASLIECISKTRGCNYYSVKSTKDFMDKMDDEFEYMVTPLVFNVCLKLKCEGNSCKIEKVYGSNEAKANEILQSGEISKIDTLFPAKRRAQRKGGGTKGGIQLIKLAKVKREDASDDDSDTINVELVVTFEDRNGRKYRNEQIVSFQSPKLGNVQKKDMIESDEDDNDVEDDTNINFYDNTGIRKGILLCKYVELMKDWIKNTGSATLFVNEEYKDILSKFVVHFKKEMVKCKDDDLQKEIDLIQKLVKVDASNSSISINRNNNENVSGNNVDNGEQRL